MKAVVIYEHGGIDQVKFAEVEKPSVQKGKVLIQVKAAALNHLDIWVRKGLPGLNLKFPHIMGSDCSGTVSEIGEGVAGFKHGDNVVINPGISCGKCEFCNDGDHSNCATFHLIGEHIDGTLAEYVSVLEANVHPMPESLSFEEAAAFPLVFVTTWRMLVTKANLKPGELLLIVGIGGGVATAALVIGKYLGARVIVTSGSDEKLAKAREIGADAGINHTLTDFSKEIRKLTDKRGVDVVMDDVGAATWRQSLASLRKGGRLVTCGATTGGGPEADIGRIFWNQLSIYGSTMGSRGDFQSMIKIFQSGRVKPVIDEIFPFEKAREAVQKMEEKRQFGKIVVTV